MLLLDCLSVIHFCPGGSDIPLLSVYSVHCVLLIYILKIPVLWNVTLCHWASSL
jgi:hypothetical protein